MKIHVVINFAFTEFISELNYTVLQKSAATTVLAKVL